MSARTHSPVGEPPAEREPEAGNYFVAAYPPFSLWETSQVPALHEVLNQPRSAEPLGLYVHVPFCQRKCDYCYYLSYVGQPAVVVNRYIDALAAELSLYALRRAIDGRPLAFVYFGGGTPSMLSVAQLDRLMSGLRSALHWRDAREVTFECAPRSVRREFLAALREAGVTRLSMGVQSFDDDLLRLNGRVHLVEDVLRAFALVHEIGFDCVNLDLMAGLVGETTRQWQESVRRAIALGPDSVTIYQTEIPHNTQLCRDLKAGRLPAPIVSWDEKRERLDWAFAELERVGYTIVSAYAAVRDPWRKRFVYQDHLWRGGDMLGIGVASFGYVGGVHYQNTTTLEDYEAHVADGRLPARRAYELSARDRLTREFILQLKLGFVPAAPFRERYGVDIATVFAEPLQRLAAEAWLTCAEDGVRLTRAGLLRADRLLPEFYAPEFRDIRYS